MALPKSIAARVGLVVLAGLIVALIAGQLLIQSVAEGGIRDRLVAGGGQAEVELEAFPAMRLLWGDGDRIAISGSDLVLEVDPDENPRAFEELDGFERVEVALDDVEAGPFTIHDFRLRREGDGPYLMATTADTSLAELADFGLGDDASTASSVIDTVLGFTGLDDDELPVDLEMRLDSDDGRIVVLDGEGTIAGVSTGPIAEAITRAIVVRL